MCDTRPWRQVFRVDFFVHTGQYGRAVEVLDDAEIADGNDDDEFARWMNSFALHALIDQGEWATAEELHESTYYKLKNNSKYMELVAKHVDYLTARGDLEAAVSLFARHFLWLAGASTNRQVFEFQLSGLLLTEALLAQAVDRLQLAAPPELELPADVRAGELAPLHAWLGAQTAHWAKRFNDRNGNDYFDRIVAERRRLVLERG
jgi:hypothetical protein